MALKNRNTNFQYVKLVDGKFYLSSDKDKKNPYDELEGVITDIGTKIDTFEGQSIKRIYVIIESEGELYNLSFNIDGSYASSFMRFIKNANIKEPLTLIPVMKEELKDGREVKRSSLLMKQHGAFMKSYYTKDNPNGLPQMKELKLNGKTVWDKTDMINFYENVVHTELKPQVGSDNGSGGGYNEKPVAKKIVESDTFDPDSDDLPF